MSNVNYSLKNKGVRLISSSTAWVTGKNGMKLNPNYRFIGKVEFGLPNMIISANPKNKQKFKGDVSSLNNRAKNELIDYFYDSNGKRNKRSVAYFGFKK